jgi:hypothetical protein
MTTPETTISKGKVREAEAVARRVTAVMRKRGLDPAFSDWLLTSDRGQVWLFGVLDLRRIDKLEAYQHTSLLHHLSTAIRGHPVYLSNSDGLRYGILLSSPPRLQRVIDFPGSRRGAVLLGRSYTGAGVHVSWSKLGHLLIAGKTGSGKSNFLRLLVHQALAEGHELLIGDLDGATFPMLADHPALQAPIGRTPEAMYACVERALGVCDDRAAHYRQMAGFPETLEEYNHQAVAHGATPLPRLVVVLDEFNAAVTAAGGSKSPLATDVAALGWRGRKFGVNLVFAAQDFAKSIVGRVRDQISAAICFKVRNAAIARNVGCPDAVHIPEGRPGLAVTDRWGAMQAYYLDKARLIEQGRKHARAALTEEERALVTWAMQETAGRLSIPLLVARRGMTEKPARKLLKAWEVRGWVKKDPQRHNARYVTPKLAALWSNGQAGQTGASEVTQD